MFLFFNNVFFKDLEELIRDEYLLNHVRGLIFINREEKAINEHESIKEEESEELKVTVNLKEIVERESSERIIIEQLQVRLNIIGGR